MSDDVTVKILIEIRDEIRKTNERLDHTNSRLEVTNQRLDNGLAAVRAEIGDLRHEVRAELADVRREMLASEMRAATRVAEQTAATRNLYDLLQDRFELRDRVERCEQDIAAIKQRL
jgi:chromosome segregation ATPase